MIGDAANRALEVEAALLERVREAISQAGVVEHLAVIDGADDDALSHSDLEQVEPGAEFDFEACRREVRLEDTLTLLNLREGGD